MKTNTVALLVMFLVGCGFVQDDDNADAQQGLNGSDLITEHPDQVCYFPSPLSGAHFSVDLRDCHKIQGSELGQRHLIDVNGGVEIDGWITKEGEGEYIGFEVTGDVAVVVKAGNHLYEAGTGVWVHPDGTSGPAAKGISFVAFCEPQGEPVCTPTDGGSNPEEPGLGQPTNPEEPGMGEPTNPDGGTTTPGTPDGGTTTPETPDGGTNSTPDGGTTPAATGCEVAACGEDGACGSNQGCYNGCCLSL